MRERATLKCNGSGVESGAIHGSLPRSFLRPLRSESRLRPLRSYRLKPVRAVPSVRSSLMLLRSLYHCGEAPMASGAPRFQGRILKEKLSSMTRNLTPPATRQRLLFPPAAPQRLDLPTDKQRELQAAVAELLLNAIMGDQTNANGGNDDESQAHA